MDGSISPVGMLSSSLHRAARGLLLSLLGPCMACGATGLNWVDDAHLESASRQRVSAVSASSLTAPISFAIPGRAEQSPTGSRPRLNHVVTLGELDVAATQSESGSQAVPGPSVIVNNYNQVSVVAPAFGYGGYGYARVPAGFSPGHVTPHSSRISPSGPLPGQSWPAVADHGPSFPYGALPASPWTRTQ
jgi:hypothetical protein